MPRLDYLGLGGFKVAHSQTDLVNLLVANAGGILLIGPLTITSTGGVLDTIPARCNIIGLGGEIDWSTSSSGATVMSMGADSSIENVYLNENNLFYFTKFKSDQFLWARYWTNFPSKAGTITSTPLLDVDGNINQESVGYITNTLQVVVTNASGTERARLEKGSAGNRGVVKLWDVTAAAFKYAYIDNGAWVIAASEPT